MTCLHCSGDGYTVTDCACDWPTCRHCNGTGETPVSNHPYQNPNSPDMLHARNSTARTATHNTATLFGWTRHPHEFWDVYTHPKRTPVTIVYAPNENHILSIHHDGKDYGTQHDWAVNAAIAIQALTAQLYPKTA